MKRLLCLLGISALLGVLSGCSETAMINGKNYRVLSEKEEKMLIRMAKDSVQRSRRSLSAEDRALCGRVEPTLKIKYDDDRHGVARITWDLPDKDLTVIMAGELMTSRMQWVMESISKTRQEDQIPRNVRKKNRKSLQQKGNMQ